MHYIPSRRLVGVVVNELVLIDVGPSCSTPGRLLLGWVTADS